jgi:transcriptional regulator of heat shock response
MTKKRQGGTGVNMKERTQKLLDYTIRNYIKTAQPVGSSLLMEKSGLNISPATIRNELMELEQNGFLFQPHTSAGRVPTEKGYNFWLENNIREKEVKKSYKNNLEKIKDGFKKDNERLIKEIAKEVSEITKSAVIIGFNENEVYYTGISNLFSQPEFRKYELIYTISEVVDDIEEILPRLFSEVKEETSVLVGSANPFSPECSIMISNISQNHLFTLLGPIRMDYEENKAVIKYLKELIN